MLTPSRLFELFTAHWTSAILASGVEHQVFEHIDQKRNSVRAIAAASGLAERSVQALLDGLVGIEAITTLDGIVYANTPAAARYLVRGKPDFLGTFARIIAGDGDGGMRQWSRLGEALRQGAPVTPETILAPDHPFWSELVRALLPLSREAARIAADHLGLDGSSEFEALDVGGGAAAYASVWLARSPRARVTQIDWAPVNDVGRAELQTLDLEARFSHVDGDLHVEDWGEQRYDYVVISNIAHHEPPERILALFEKAFRALKRGGAVLVSEFMLRDDRSGPPFALRFAAGMVLQTTGGGSYRIADYRGWLERAGFTSSEVDVSHELSTLLFARRTR
jgi:ubiquinone/menaquinone biosynthesis C-methylase UbiE